MRDTGGRRFEVVRSVGAWLLYDQKVRRAVLAAALLSTSILAGCAKPEVTAQSYYESAMQLIAKKEDIAARLELLNSLKYKQDKIEVWRALAGVDERTGELKGLFRDLKRITQLDPTDNDAKLRLARLLVQAGVADPAQDIVNEIDDSAKPSADLHAVKAMIAVRQKDAKAAVAEAKKAADIDPTNKDAQLILASQQASQAKYADAVQSLNKADTGSADPRISGTKVQLYVREGDLAKAEAELKRLIEANPKEAVYHAQLAQLYMSQRRNDEAEREFRAVAQLKPAESKPVLDLVAFIASTKGAVAAQQELEARIKAGGAVFDYQVALAKVEFAQGNFDQAKNLLQTLISSEKSAANVATARTELAQLYFIRKDFDSAEKAVNEVLTKDRRNLNALKLRSAIRMNEGQIDNAIADLREALNDQPKAPDLLLSMAQAYERGGKVELADRQYNDAIKASNYNPTVGLAYVAFLQRTSSAARADDILQELANRNPQNADLLSQLAQVRLSQKNFAGAIQVADALTKLGKNDALADQIRAAALAGQNKPDESIAALEKAHAESPTALQPIVGLVSSYSRQKQYDKAEALLQDMMTKFPENPQLLLLLGQVQQIKGATDDAIKSYQNVIAHQPQSDMGYSALTQIYTQQKRYDDAIGVTDAGLQQKPGDVNFRLARASLLDLKGDHEGAIGEYEGILKDQPQSAVAINNLVSMLIDYRTDKASSDRAQELAEKLKNTKVPQFQDTLGWALYQRGDFAGASDLLEQAKSQLPNLAAIRYHLAMAYRALGQKDKADAELKAAMDLEPDGTPLKQKIAASLKQQG